MSSIEVNWWQRRAKAYRLDVEKLLAILMRYALEEHGVSRVVCVPSVEDDWQLQRELGWLGKVRIDINRIKSLVHFAKP